MVSMCHELSCVRLRMLNARFQLCYLVDNNSGGMAQHEFASY
jgi:hypothetical protein